MREDALARAQPLRQGIERARRDDHIIGRERRQCRADLSDAVLPADATARVDREGARVALFVDTARKINAGRRLHIEDIGRGQAIGVGTWPQREQFGAGAQDAFAEQKAGRELLILAGGAHDGREGFRGRAGRRRAHPQFKRLLDGQLVALSAGLVATPTRDFDGHLPQRVLG